MSQNEDMSMEKIVLNDLLMEIVNEVLEEEGEGLKLLRVEEVDVGILICPDGTLEVIKSPVYKDDVRENTGMLIDMRVREVVKGLLNRVLIRLHINERREVVIKNKGVQEAEILDIEFKDIELRKELEKILEGKSNTTSEAVKVALERIMG